MKVNLELGRLILYKAAWLKDQRRRSIIEAPIAKLFLSESLKEGLLDSLQIHGAYGFAREFGIEMDVRNCLAATIYSGTSETQRNVIAAMVGV